MKNNVLLFLMISFILFIFVGCSQNNVYLVETEIMSISEEEFVEKIKDLHGERVLIDLVEEKFLNEKYNIEEKEIVEELEKLKSGFESEEQFDEFLNQNQIKDMSELENKIEIGLMRRALIVEGMDLSEENLRDFYNEKIDYFTEVEAKHILVEEEELANELLSKINAGEEFDDLAMEYSKDSSNADNGGYLGVFRKGTMVPEFEEVVFKSEIGDLIGPVKTQFGFHVIKLVNKTELEFSDNLEQIEGFYINENAESYENVLMKKLKENNLKINDKKFEHLFGN